MSDALARSDQTPQTLRDLRRAQIVAAGRGIVVARGLEALTISAIEQSLDFSRGVITYHFRNKDEIVREVLQSALAEIETVIVSRVDAHADPTERFVTAVESTMRGFLAHDEASQILLAFWGRIRVDEDIRSANAALYAKYRRWTATLVREGAAVGAFRAVDADSFSATVVGAVIGLVSQVNFDDGALDVDAAITESVACLVARLQIIPGAQ